MKRPAEAALEATLLDLLRQVPSPEAWAHVTGRGFRRWRRWCTFSPLVLGAVLAALAVGAAYSVGLGDVGLVAAVILLAVLIVLARSSFQARGETVRPLSLKNFLVAAAWISLVFQAIVILTDPVDSPGLGVIAVAFGATVVAGLLFAAVSWSRVGSRWHAWLFGSADLS